MTSGEHVSAHSAGESLCPRSLLRVMVHRLLDASRQDGLSSLTVYELEEAARLVNLADPRFHGGVDGVAPEKVAADIAAALRLTMYTIGSEQVRAYVESIQSTMDRRSAVLRAVRRVEVGAA